MTTETPSTRIDISLGNIPDADGTNATFDAHSEQVRTLLELLHQGLVVVEPRAMTGAEVPSQVASAVPVFDRLANPRYVLACKQHRSLEACSTETLDELENAGWIVLVANNPEHVFCLTDEGADAAVKLFGGPSTALPIFDHEGRLAVELLTDRLVAGEIDTDEYIIQAGIAAEQFTDVIEQVAMCTDSDERYDAIEAWAQQPMPGVAPMPIGDVAERAEALIEEYGHFVQHVLAEEGGLPYSYTSGLSYARDDKYPELAMTGLPATVSQQLLDNAAEALKDGRLELGGPRYCGKLIANFDAALVPIRPSTSKSFLGVPDDADAYLIVMPDKNGLFPWDEGCDPMFARQIERFDIIALPEVRVPKRSASNTH